MAPTVQFDNSFHGWWCWYHDHIMMFACGASYVGAIILAIGGADWRLALIYTSCLVSWTGWSWERRHAERTDALINALVAEHLQRLAR